MKDPSAATTQKLNKTEKSWILYDWANSVYATNILAAIFPIYYASIAGDVGDKWYGIGVAAASLIVAIMAPLLGSIGDSRGMKKKFLTSFMILGVVFTALMAFVADWKWMLIGYVISHIGFSGANVFYDSFLTDVTTEERMDKVSAWGYAMGYLGGSTIPFVISIAFLLATGFSTAAVKFSILITSVWWAVFSIPILRNVKQVHYVDTPASKLARTAFRNLWDTLKSIVKSKGLLLFLVAYFFYIDGVNTVISIATNYGATLGLGSTGMIIALLVTQLVAVPCSILFSRLSKRVGAIRMIGIAVGIYSVICCVGFFMGHTVEPYQLEYDHMVTTAANKDLELSNPHDQKVYEQVLADIRENGKNKLAAEDRVAAFYSVGDEGKTSGVLGDVLTRLNDKQSVVYSFRDDDNRLAVLNEVERMQPIILTYAQDTQKKVDYDSALGTASTLFWLMAVLVGTVQGGIQALSRSYFGKLIPADQSNRYFGFFDIFGKFAAVIGPLLYSTFYILTDRASVGILGLLLLFITGGLVLFLGRHELRKAAEKAHAQAVGEV